MATQRGGGDEPKGNRIQKAISHRIELFGIPWQGFLLIVTIAVVLFEFVDKWLGIGSLFLTTPMVRLIFKVEPHPVKAFALWWSWGRHSLDAGNRHSVDLIKAGSPWHFLYQGIVKRFSNHEVSKI